MHYQHLLQRIEKEAKDDLSYFNQLDSHHFTTAELYRLLGQWEVKDRLFQQTQEFTLWTVASSPFWLIVAFVFNLLIWTKLAFLFVTLFYLSIVIIFIGFYVMDVTFHGNGYLPEVGEKIKEELRKRQQ